MKKHRLFISAICAVIATLLLALFCGCTGKTEAKVTLLKNEEKIVVIRADETNTDLSLYDALKKLQGDGKLTFDGYTGDFGFTLTTLNGYTPEYAATNEYWALFTDLGTVDGITYSSTEFGNIEESGATCGYANYGISGLPLIAGKIYVLKTEVSAL